MVLGWHEHLLGCGECRILLEQEEALESLLASLPEPRLSEDLTQRVLHSLRRARDLDDLLAMDQVQVPEGLGGRIHAGLQAQRQEARLDELLTAAGSVEIPAGLEQRTLNAVRERIQAVPERSQVHRFRPLQRAAAVLVLSLGAAALWRGFVARPAQLQGPDLAQADAEVIALLPELLALRSIESLDPIERELIVGLDLSDEALLDAEGS